MGNIPVLFFATTKTSPLGFLAGLSYEKINAFHRWVGRLIFALFLTHGIMMGYLMIKRDETPLKLWIARRDVQWGIAAVSCLLLLLILYPPA
jgi:ferric-chelate reductase